MGWLLEHRERLERFRQGDTATLAEVFQVYSLPLARTLAQGLSLHSGGEVLRLRGGRLSAFELDDLVQEVFIKAFGESARLAYDGLRPFGGYLLGIARNAMIDRYRRSVREVPLLEPDQQAADEAPSPEGELLEAELRRVYGDFLASLDEKDRLLVELRFEGQRPRREVEEKTGLSPMQVRTREKRLRKALYDRLVGAGYGAGAAALLTCLLLPMGS